MHCAMKQILIGQEGKDSNCLNEMESGEILANNIPLVNKTQIYVCILYDSVKHANNNFEKI